MITDKIIDSIIKIKDETGGDSALDGFEFQMSSAIFLFFDEMLNNRKNNRIESILVYEKVEDFIIFNEHINLYQAKSTSRSLTPNFLYSASKKTISDDSGLSIIEKLNLNYLKVKNILVNVKKTNVKTTLIICENQIFSKKLSKDLEGIEDLRIINFNDLSNETKLEIINKTTFDNYDWDNINAIRIIPKKRHEEVTRVHIEDIVTEMFGENKINSSALYTSLIYELKKIRINKSQLSSTLLESKIKQFSEIKNLLKFSDQAYLLNENDKRNIKIAKNFTQIQNNILINNHPVQADYENIKILFKEEEFDSYDEVIIRINELKKFNSLRIRLSEYELKALVLLVMVREVIE